jgi:23S rRNA (guanosine2251-2'-O)-methyltransferase
MTRPGGLVCGFHAVRMALEKHPRDLEGVWLSASRADARVADIERLAQSAGVAVHRVERDDLDRLAGEARHQGVAAKRRRASAVGEDDLSALLAQAERPLVLALDGVQDPHNLGACLRSAAAAGAQAVLVPRDNSAPLTAVALRAAAGAAEIVPVIPVTNLARALRALKELGVWVYGASHDADATLYEADLSGPVALVLGGEGRGLRRLTREHCDGLVRIPMPGAVESLNVSVAAGVCLFEVVRQRSARRRGKSGG